MREFFYPERIAVVGVSENPTNLARGIVAHLLAFGYQGKIYPIGPRGGNVFGLPVLSQIEDLPEPVDLAVILTPARFVPQVVATCGKLGISRIVVESGGFSEVGEKGKALEKEIRSLLTQYGMRLVGPNGIGTINMEIGLVLPFSQMGSPPRQGNISVIAQSGGVALHIFAVMAREGLGLNKFLSLGNKLDVAENEALAYLLEDPGTKAIYLYLEGLEDGRGLLSLAQKASKPIFLHLVNVVPETAAIGQSHTASLTTDELVLEAACRQFGILWIKSQAEFLVGAKMAGQPPVKGNRLVVLSRSGGEALITAYSCRQWGFELPPLSPRVERLVKERARSGIIKPTNPIDLGDIFDFSVYSEVMGALCRDPEVDAVVLNYGPVYEAERPEAREMARLLVEQARTSEKPLAVTVLATLEEEEFFRESLNLPVFHFPGEAVRALAYSRFLWTRSEAGLDLAATTLPGAAKIAAILAGYPKAGFLPQREALDLAAALGIATAGWELAASPHDAKAAARRIGYPVVLKLAASALVHKTEAGGVLLNLQDEAAVDSGFAKLARIAQEHLSPGEPWQVVVMAQAASGHEVLLGARRDQSFGPIVAFGAGGVATEVLEDISLRVAPIHEAEARRLIAETRMGRLLAGFRGQPAGDLEALGRALVSLSQLMLQFPRVEELDLNPVRVFPGRPGILALDARIKVEKADYIKGH
ncbi:MAG: acetate--CoA ligase family protein [Thermodesulfobacteriota bacterium]